MYPISSFHQAEDLEPATDPKNALKVDVGKSKVIVACHTNYLLSFICDFVFRMIQL